MTAHPTTTPPAFDLRAHTILLCLSGSRAYGVHTAASDVDLHGICIPPRSHFTGFVRRLEQVDKPEAMQVFLGDLSAELQKAALGTKLEGTVYGIHKFFTLARDCNPNLIQLLYTHPDDVVLRTPAGRKLTDHRDLFLSQNARFRFSGYAMSQLARIKLHRGYLLHPMNAHPDRAAFDLPPKASIRQADLDMVHAQVAKQLDRWNDGFLGEVDESLKMRIRESFAQVLGELKISEATRVQHACHQLGFDDDFTAYFQRENAYQQAVKQWESYQKWKRERNPERAAMEARFGYDGKHAAHLVRLGRMAVEILRDGVVKVRRDDDADELLAIRNGAWSYERLVEHADTIDATCAELYKSSASKLPLHPDLARLDELCMELVEEHLRWR